ncbi:MAG: hypothetical protein ACFFCS_11450 [Candidatus Hodarchaeota archaeon]
MRSHVAVAWKIPEIESLSGISIVDHYKILLKAKYIPRKMMIVYNNIIIALYLVIFLFNLCCNICFFVMY